MFECNVEEYSVLTSLEKHESPFPIMIQNEAKGKQ